MAIRNLTNWNDPKFRKSNRPVKQFDERLWTLLVQLDNRSLFVRKVEATNDGNVGAYAPLIGAILPL